MDEQLRDFLTETNESIDVVDVEFVRFERESNNAKILDNIFRLVHTIKGTCGFSVSRGSRRSSAMTRRSRAVGARRRRDGGRPDRELQAAARSPRPVRAQSDLAEPKRARFRSAAAERPFGTAVSGVPGGSVVY
jgi:hypothetical protein